MFFARIMMILIVLGFIYLLWLKIVKPFLEDHGVQVDEDVETEHTKRLDKTKQEHAETVLSAKAIEEELELKKQLKYADEDIERTEEEMKKL